MTIFNLRPVAARLALLSASSRCRQCLISELVDITSLNIPSIQPISPCTHLTRSPTSRRVSRVSPSITKLLLMSIAVSWTTVTAFEVLSTPKSKRATSSSSYYQCRAALVSYPNHIYSDPVRPFESTFRAINIGTRDRQYPLPEESAACCVSWLCDGDREVTYRGDCASTTAISPRRSEFHCSGLSRLSTIKTRVGILVEKIPEEYRKE